MSETTTETRPADPLAPYLEGGMTREEAEEALRVDGNIRAARVELVDAVMRAHAGIREAERLTAELRRIDPEEMDGDDGNDLVHSLAVAQRELRNAERVVHGLPDR